MSSKEDYLDSLLDSVMKDSNESNLNTNNAEMFGVSEDADSTIADDFYEQSDEPMTPADEMLALLDQLERAERGDVTESEDNLKDVAEESEFGEISELADMPETAELSGLTDMPEMSELSGLTDMPEMSELSGLTDMPEMSELSGLTDMPEMSELSGLSDMPEMSELPDVPEMLEEPDFTENQEESGTSEIFGMSEMSGLTDELVEEDEHSDEAVDPAMNDLFDLFANEREEFHADKEEMPADMFSDVISSNPDIQDEMSDEELVKSLFAGEELPVEEADDGTDWDTLLEPTESKGEKKARKKKEKQEERARLKEEKLKQKEEKLKQKEEKANKKKTSKKNTKDAEKDEGSSDLSAEEEELMLLAASVLAEEEAQSKPKKQGFFGRLLSGLLEEVESEDELAGMDVSDENMAILEAVGSEEINPQVDKKKGKKDKKKKSKKNQKDSKAKSPDGDVDAENDEKEDKKSQKAAKKKAKKAMKEELAALEGPAKKLPRKKVISIFAVCFTLFAVILLCSLFVPSYLNKNAARKAYYNGDYETAYEMFSGEKLSGSDAILYERTVFILFFDNKLDSYELNISIDREKEAVHELLSAVSFYQENLERMSECGVIDDVQSGYMKILSLLEEQYELSEERAIEITQYEILDYNKALYEILNGTEFTIPQMQEENGMEVVPDVEPVTPKPEDVLPEEEELLQSENINMIDNTEGIEYDVTEDEDSVSENDSEIPDESVADDSQQEEEVLYSGTIENGQVIVQ